MKTLYTTLFVAAMLASPYAVAAPAQHKMSHEAWIAAQKIDIPPTIKMTETKIPAGSEASGSTMPHQMPSSTKMSTESMPANQMPSSGQPMNMPHK